MKKLVTIFALFTMVILTSFTSPMEIGGKDRDLVRYDIGGKDRDLVRFDIGGKDRDLVRFDIGGKDRDLVR